MASGVDLAALGEEIHEFVYTLVSATSTKGADVVGVLLDLHVLEDEQTILRRRINEMLSQVCDLLRRVIKETKHLNKPS